MSAKGKRKIWRTVQTARGKALRSPDGKLYYGTRQEVRDAALLPVRRDMLAGSLSLERYLRDWGTLTQGQFIESCAESRREAIQYGTFDATHGVNVDIPADAYILLSAGSRLVRDDFGAYLSELWRSEISSLLDVVEEDTGKREIPLTRHERAALKRLGADVRKFDERAIVEAALADAKKRKGK